MRFPPIRYLLLPVTFSSTVKAAMAPSTSKKILQTLDPCVVLMKEIVSQYTHIWEQKQDKIYSLAQGVVYWEPPKQALEACRNALSDASCNKRINHNSNNKNPIDGEDGSSPSLDIHLYGPDNGLPELVSKLEHKLRFENGLQDVSVMVTAGANQAYMNCVLTIMDDDDKAVVFAPYYFNHVMALQMHIGDENILVGPSIPMKNEFCENANDNNGIFIPDLKWLEEILQKNDDNSKSSFGRIRMVTVVNPGNPTGVSIPYPIMEKFVSLCEKYNVWLVIDNTYEHFDHSQASRVSEGDDDSIIPFKCCNGDNVINIFSFSKCFSLAGFRIGYLTTSTKNCGALLMDQMTKVQDTIPICVSRMSQIAAIGALDAGREWVYDRVSTLELGRKFILDALSPLEETIGGSGAMYVMGRLPNGVDDVQFATYLVEKYGVAIIPGSFCGFPGWIRVCYSNLPSSDCEIAASRLGQGILSIMNR